MASSDPKKDRQQRVDRLCEEHRSFILDTLRHEGVHADAAKDLAQEVELILREHVEDERPLPSPRGFLTRVIQFVARNHKRFEGRRANAGVDVDVLPSQELDPERRAQKEQLWAKVIRYLADMPEHLAWAVYWIDMEGLGFEEAAEKLGRPAGTVSTHRARGIEMLKEMARRSTQETETGVRRRRIAAAAAAARRAREKLAR